MGILGIRLLLVVQYQRLVSVQKAVRKTSNVSSSEYPRDPCQPSPCGPNSLCRIVNQVAVCSCQPGQVGSPPNCRPECVVSAECPLTQACLGNKCRDPCPGTCGVSAKCQVVNHNPICSCPSGLTGDPFTRCYSMPGKRLSKPRAKE